MNIKEIKQAAIVLNKGGVISYPSEGVWGLGCDPYNEKAVEQILTLKGRPVDKGLILVASSMAQIEPLLKSLSSADRTFLQSIWPGPETWLLPDSDQIIPAWIKGKFVTVAIRVSSHPVVKALCECFDGLMVSTSANPGSFHPAKTIEQVRIYFPDGLDYLVSGELGGSAGPSAIKDLLSAGTVRE